MASHVVVIDTSFRRTTIKITPGKYVSDILEEACAKFGLKASNYGLK
jgi:tether containing UBX domain for GLUT4